MKESTKRLFAQTPTTFGHIISEDEEAYYLATSKLFDTHYLVSRTDPDVKILSSSRIYFHELSAHLYRLDDEGKILYRNNFVIPDTARGFNKVRPTVDLDKVIPIGLEHLKYMLTGSTNSSIPKTEACRDALIYVNNEPEMLDGLLHFIGRRQTILSLNLVPASLSEITVHILVRLLDLILDKKFPAITSSVSTTKHLNELATKLVSTTDAADIIEEKMKAVGVWKTI